MATAASDPTSDRRIFDITAALGPDLVTWPDVVERFERSLLTSIDDGDPMTVSHFLLGAHAGTHVDAPNHFIEDAAGIEAVPLEAMIGQVQVVEIPQTCSLITADVLAACDIPTGTIRLIAKTRNSGWSTEAAPFRMDYVAFDISAAQWCLATGIRLLGIDYLSVEPFDADERDYPVHRLLLDAGVVVVESLDLGNVSPGTYELIVLPLLVPGADGAPARALLLG